MSSKSDHELIRLVRQGHPEAFNEIVMRYQDKVFNLALRHVGNANDAADIAQQTFVNAYRSLASFKEEANLATWLYRIVFNQSVSFFRERGRNRTVSMDGAPRDDDEPAREIASSNGDPSHHVMNRDLSDKINAVLAQLDEESRRIVILREFENYAYEEIAEILAIPVGTVRSKLHRARLVLKEKLSGHVAKELKP
jgi:RNA polymerase sigma-70 factor (ECF subfamily)